MIARLSSSDTLGKAGSVGSLFFVIRDNPFRLRVLRQVARQRPLNNPNRQYAKQAADMVGHQWYAKGLPYAYQRVKPWVKSWWIRHEAAL